MSALGAVGCKNAEQEGPGTQQKGKTVTLVATLEQPVATKTALSAERKVLWSPGDAIKVYNAAHPEGVEYALSGGEGTGRGSFSGPALEGGGPFYAVYPASVAGTLDGGAVSVSLPQVQAYAEGSFGPGAAVSMAQADDIASLSFKNVLGGVSLNITGDKTISRVRLQTKGGEPLFGLGRLKMDGETPVLSLEAGSDDSASFLYLDGPGATSASFCLMLPPGAFENGFMVEYLDSEGKVMFRSAKADVNKVRRSHILTMPSSTYAPAYKASFFAADSFGVYTSVGMEGELDGNLAYDVAGCQYAFRTGEDSRYVRVQSLSQGFYTEALTPLTLKLGETVEATATILKGHDFSTVSGHFTALQKSGDRVWLVSEDGQVGIIQKMGD